MRDLPNKFYVENNKVMADTYEAIASTLKINWNKYFSNACEFLDHDQYRIWIFLCGLRNTFDEALIIRKTNKKQSKQYIKKTTLNRLFSIKQINKTLNQNEF